MRSRMIISVSLALSFCAALASVSLVPTLFVYKTATADLSARTAALGAPAGGSADIAAAQATAAQIALLARPATSTETMRGIISMRPAGIALSALSYTAGRPSTISLSGTAASPDALDAYRAALRSDTRFSSVSVPIGALIGSKDGSFTITISGAF